MQRTTVISPNTGQPYGSWQPDSADKIESALVRLDRNRSCLASDIASRCDVLQGVHDALKAGRAEIERLTVEEVGKKPEEAAAEFDYALSFLEYCQTQAQHHVFVWEPSAGKKIREVTPGVALLITPYNDPVAGIIRKIAPAIAAGAPVLVKPAPLGMLTAKFIEKTLDRAGLSDFTGLVALDDPNAIGELIADPRVGVVSFTGSTRIGGLVSLVAAQNYKRAVLELGGNVPFVVLPGANMEKAINDLVARKARAAGQACSSVNRAYVHRSILVKFRDVLAARVDALSSGPSTSGADVGPVRTRQLAGQLESWTSQAVNDGAKRLAGPGKAAAEGTPIVFPFTLLETGQSSLFDHHETFGPLLPITGFDSFDDLLVRLSRERHALVAYFYGPDPEALLPRLEKLRFGSIGINSTAIQGPDVPTGGFGEAGVGREGGSWGLREFLTTVNIRMGAPA